LNCTSMHCFLLVQVVLNCTNCYNVHSHHNCIFSDRLCIRRRPGYHYRNHFRYFLYWDPRFLSTCEGSQGKSQHTSSKASPITSSLGNLSRALVIARDSGTRPNVCCFIWPRFLPCRGRRCSPKSRHRETRRRRNSQVQINAPILISRLTLSDFVQSPLLRTSIKSYSPFLFLQTSALYNNLYNSILPVRVKSNA